MGCAAVGLYMAHGFRHGLSTGGNARAGFFLGILLLIVGAFAFLAGGKQTITVDGAARRIVVEDETRWGKKARIIPFGDVLQVSLGYLGKKSNYVEWHYLVLHLRDGKEYPLFAPGRFFDGSSDRNTVEGWQRRLREYLAHRPTI
ncbi:MAG: hypothetical protein IPP68_07660 [Elusimicrobia bacterium]|nr:hypothetical protein [Elusimicrobiota bacterium]